MRAGLAQWANDADALYHIEQFGFVQLPLPLSYVRNRGDDFFTALMAELFDRLREPYPNAADWSRLGNAITQAGGVGNPDGRAFPGIDAAEAAVFAATAFYLGGYSASAYLTLKAVPPASLSPVQLACYELLSKPRRISSDRVRELVGAVRRGDLSQISAQRQTAEAEEETAFGDDPNSWVSWRLYARILRKFEATNIRAVLPDGGSTRWDPLVRSLLNRYPPAWDFFPSQIDAIRSGLLSEESSFSIQMPTGAGKTALSETLLFHHLSISPNDVALLLVPFRALAAELRGTLARNLTRMGLPTRCVYGGTVPTVAEAQDLESVRAIVATPEALSGLLSSKPDLFARVSLVVCDEGHLLDGDTRGVGLELLIARMKARAGAPPKFVFVSAIVPNIDEINAWLGGTDRTVVRSEYRPSIAEFALLERPSAAAGAAVSLRLHPHLPSASYSIDSFLSREDFRFRNPATGRLNSFPFTSVKTIAVAAARKAMAMGSVAIFSANKRGQQGAVGLAAELLAQLDKPLALPNPVQFVRDAARLQAAVEYFVLEYGAEWVGTKVLALGAALHHGDIPQESREVTEDLVRDQTVRLAICTSTLAEGVNLPIRTLVLYSVQRREHNGVSTNLLARDIKNLVGRAGRAGSATRGLVICANSGQWPLVEPVALQQPGESVTGALLKLMARLRAALQQQNLSLTNALLEATTPLHTLIDGIDATLIDLATEEIGEEALVAMASELSRFTFASRQAPPETADLLTEVFTLRAQRVAAIASERRLAWIKETGTRPRMLSSVQEGLLPLMEAWDTFESPLDETLVKALLTWAWTLPEVAAAVNEAYGERPPPLKDFLPYVRGWLEGAAPVELARSAELDVDSMLFIHARTVGYALQTSVEQGVALLSRLLKESGQELSQSVIDFPDHLRFGVPTRAARILAAGGVRHRRAAVALGTSAELSTLVDAERDELFTVAQLMLRDEQRWIGVLGKLVLDNTIADLREPVDSPEGD